MKTAYSRRHPAARTARSIAATAFVVLATASLSPTLGDTWDNSSNDSQWSTANNWEDNTEPTPADPVIFPSPIPKNLPNIGLAGSEVASSLTLDDNYTLGGTASPSLELSGGGVSVAGGKSGVIQLRLTGTAGLTKTGAGTLTLRVTNDFTGDVNINAGTLVVATDPQFGNAANNVNFDTGALSVPGNLTTARTFTMGPGGGTILPDGTLTLTFALGATGNALTVGGSGTLELSAASSRSGATSLLDGAYVRLTHGAALGTGLIALENLSLGAILELAGVNVTQPLALGSNGSLLGTGNAIYSGTITAASSAPSLYLWGGNNAADTLTVSNYTGGSGSTTHVETIGEVILPSPSAYAGEWLIGNGRLRVDHATALGTNPSPVIVDGGTLHLHGVTLTRDITMNNGATLRGSLQSLLPGRAAGTVSVASGADVIFASDFSFPTPLEIGDSANDLTGGGGGSSATIDLNSVVKLAAPSDYTGDWIVRGLLEMSDDNQLGNVLNTLTIDQAMLETTGAIAMSRPVIVNGGEAAIQTDGTLTLNSGLTGTAEVLSVSTIAGSTGTMVLNAAGSFSADHINVFSTLKLNHNSAAGTTPFQVSGIGSVLELGPDVTLSQPVTLLNLSTLRGNNNARYNGTVTVDTVGGADVTLATIAPGDDFTIGNNNIDLTGGGAGSSITAAGPGTIILARQSNYNGGWIVSGGTLQLAEPGALGPGGGSVEVAAGATLELEAGVNLNRQITMGDGATLRAENGFASMNQNIFIQDGATAICDVNTGSNLTISGTINPSSMLDTHLTKTGPGTLTLSAFGNLIDGRFSVLDGNVAQFTGSIQITDSLSIGTGVSEYISTGGSLTAEGIYVGGTPTAAGGTGVLNVGGGAVTASGVVKVWNTTFSAINLSAGSLTADSLDTDGNPSHFNWTGGMLNITGAGGLVLGSDGAPVASLVVGPSQDLNASQDVTINAGGQLTVGGGDVTAENVVDNGSLIVTSGTLDAEVLGAGNDGTLNGGSGSGTILISGGSVSAGAVLLGSAVGGSGDLTISGAGELTTNRLVGNDVIVDGGTVTVLDEPIDPPDSVLDGSLVGGYLRDGAFYVNAGAVTTPNIKLGVTAGMTGTYQHSGGTLAAGSIFVGSDAGGIGAFRWSGGTLNTQSLEMAGDATLGVDLSGPVLGTDFAQLQISGNAALTGTLDITRTGGFDASAGQSFVIMTFGSRTGEFATVTGLSAGPGLVFQVQYNPGNVTLVVNAAPPGDCDADGDIDLDDHADYTDCLGGPLGGLGSGCECADFDDDGHVTLFDWAEFQVAFTGP